MLGWAITFLIVALVAALLGFGMIAGVAIEAAKIVFFVAIVLFAISVIVGMIHGGRFRRPAFSGQRKSPMRGWLAWGFYFTLYSALNKQDRLANPRPTLRRLPARRVLFHPVRNPRRC